MLQITYDRLFEPFSLFLRDGRLIFVPVQKNKNAEHLLFQRNSASDIKGALDCQKIQIPLMG